MTQPGPLARGSLLRIMRGAALSLLGAVMLMWVALANGRPAVFSDTALYYDQAEYLFEALHWVSPGHAVSPPDDPAALPARPGAANMPAAIDGARSPVYGAPIYALQRAGGLWLVAFAQAWAASAAIYLLCRAAAPSAPRWGYLALMAGVAALTPLPFFTGWIMPDVFAGVALCGLLILLVYPDRLGRGGRAGAAVLGAYGLAVHRSNLLDAAGVAACAVVLLRVGGVAWRQVTYRVATVALTVIAAVVVSAAPFEPIRARAGEAIGSPPFMSARVLADGPGRRFLRQACAHAAPYALCPFRNRPLATSDQILWSHNRREAVFFAASPAVRLRMEREDARFALAESLAEPQAQARATARNSVRQFVLAYVDDPLKTQGFYVADGFWRRTSLPRIITDAANCPQEGDCAPRVGMAISVTLEATGLLAAALLLVWRLSAGDVRQVLRRRADADWRDQRVRTLTTLALIASLLVINAVVCGALSGPFPRYQARLIWMFPLEAGLCILALGVRRRPLPSPGLVRGPGAAS